MPSDDFNRADGSIGADWTQLVGTWTIDANQAECNDNDGGTGYYCRYDGAGADVGSSDMWCEGVTNSTQTGGISNAGVAVRHRTGATTGYQFTTHTNDSCALWRVNAGSETQITTFNTAVAVGDVVRLEAVGRTFRFKVNDALRVLFQDTNITDGQRAALNGYNEDSTGDVVRFDRWAAGAMSELLAPFLADWSAQVTGTGSLTPVVPAQVVAGDLVCVLATLKSTTNSHVPPGSQGWSQVQLASGNGLRAFAFTKVWGTGDTDDTTPTFTRSGGTDAGGATVLIIRNPAHATAPWTTVASAVVASGQQSNTASATITAPSVTDTGGHRTVLRLFSSGQANAIGGASEGILVFGGAAYDQTTGTDYAQGASIVEDVTLAGSTGTATATETVEGATAGFDANNGITLVVAVPVTAVDLAPDDAVHGHAADSPAVTQVHVLAAADAGQAHSAESPTLTQVHVLAPGDAAHAHTADQSSVSVVSALAPDDAAHTQTAESPALTQAHSLPAADSTHTTSAESPALTQAHSLVSADASHTQTADQPAVTQAHVLTPSDAGQAQIAESATLTQAHQLAAADALHGQAAEQPSLSEAGPSDLFPADAVHAHSAEQPALTQQHALVPADALHGHTAGSPTLGLVHTLQPAGAVHAHSAESPGLGQLHVLGPADALHAQEAGSPSLGSFGPDVPSQGTFDDGRGVLVYASGTDPLTYDTGGALIYDP